MIFDDPKVGDIVAIYNGRDRDPAKKTISRVTQTQIEVEGIKYLRRTGFAVGGSSYDRPHAAPWTPEVDKRIEARRVESVRAETQRVSLDALKSATQPLAVVGGKSRQTGNNRQLTLEQCAQVNELTALIKDRVAGIVGVDP